MVFLQVVSIGRRPDSEVFLDLPLIRFSGFGCLVALTLADPAPHIGRFASRGLPPSKSRFDRLVAKGDAPKHSVFPQNRYSPKIGGDSKAELPR